MHFSINDYRDTIYPDMPIKLLGDINFQVKIFNRILSLSNDGIFNPVQFDLHHETSDLLLFEFQDEILQELINMRLIFKVTGYFIINPKVIKFIESRDQLRGNSLNPN